MKEKTAASAKLVFFWNMMGSLCNAASTVVLTMVVTRLTGSSSSDADIFGLALGVAQWLMTVGAFEVRPYQATDVGEKFQFSDYFAARIVSCVLMMAISAIVIFSSGYTQEKGVVVFLLCLFKMIDAFSDVFHGMFQQHERLDLAGKSLAFRVCISTASFTIALALTKQLILSLIVMIVVSVIWVLLYDATKVGRFAQWNWRFSLNTLRKLFVDCLPLFASSFMLNYMLSAPKFSVDSYCGPLQRYWTIIFMPASVINLFSIFIFRPMLTTLATSWNLKDWHTFGSIVKRVILSLIFLTAAVLAGGYFLGTPVLSWLYGLDLSVYRIELMVVLLGGGISAFSTVLYYLITVMRKQYSLLLGYAIPFLLSFALVPLFVQNWELMGASLSYFSVMAIQALAFLVLFLINYRKEKRRSKEIAAKG